MISIGLAEARSSGASGPGLASRGRLGGEARDSLDGERRGSTPALLPGEGVDLRRRATELGQQLAGVLADPWRHPGRGLRLAADVERAVHRPQPAVDEL